jgi:hypothetical protein
MRVLKYVFIGILSLAILFGGFILFALLVAFGFLNFSQEARIQSMLKERCETTIPPTHNGERIIYSYIKDPIRVRYEFHKNGKIALFTGSDNEDNNLNCIVPASQPLHEFEELKEFIKSRYPKSEFHDSCPPFPVEVFTVDWVNPSIDSLHVGYSCHILPDRFKEIKDQINTLVKSKLLENLNN